MFTGREHRPEREDVEMPAPRKLFTKDTSVLFKGNYYLLKTPQYCESGYTIALYKGMAGGEPCFEDESWGLDISGEVIEGWVAVKGLR